MSEGDWGTLPTITVYANPPAVLNPYWGTGIAADFPIGMPPMYDPVGLGTGAVANGAGVFNASMGLDSYAGLRCLEAFCKGVSGRPGQYLKNQLTLVKGFHSYMAWYAELAGVSKDGFTREDSLVTDGAKIAGLFGDYFYRKNTGWTFDSGDFDWHAGPLMPIAALAHWVDGNGQNVKLSLKGLGLSLRASNIQGNFNAEIQKSRAPGTYEIDMPFSYNTFNEGLWVGGTVGRVNGQIRGTLTVYEDHTYTFDGKYSLNPDFYNADLSNRTWAQEALTDFLRWIGETFGHTDYFIEFDGEVPFSTSGMTGAFTSSPNPPTPQPIYDIGNLPVMTAYAAPSSADPYWGYGANTQPTYWSDPMPPDFVTAAYDANVNGTAFWSKVEQGSRADVLEELAKQISARPAYVAVPQLRVWGQANDFLTYYWALREYPAGAQRVPRAKIAEPGHLASVAGEFLWVAGGLGQWNYRDVATEWKGSPLLFVKAVQHWLDGDGAPVSIPTSGMDLNMTPAKLQGELLAYLQTPMQKGANIFMRPYEYDTSAPDAGVAGSLGRIGGVMVGIVWVNDDNTYVFDATFTLNADTFNADPTNRPWMKPDMAALLTWMGDAYGRKDYTITYTGTDRLQFYGVVDPQTNLMVLPTVPEAAEY